MIEALSKAARGGGIGIDLEMADIPEMDDAPERKPLK
jgi:hypothetical protein